MHEHLMKQYYLEGKHKYFTICEQQVVQTVDHVNTAGTSARYEHATCQPSVVFAVPVTTKAQTGYNSCFRQNANRPAF